MRIRLFLSAVYICLFVISCNEPATISIDSIDPGSYDGTWWNRTPIRLVQTNFPEIYANMDVESYVRVRG